MSTSRRMIAVGGLAAVLVTAACSAATTGKGSTTGASTVPGSSSGSTSGSAAAPSSSSGAGRSSSSSAPASGQSSSTGSGTGSGTSSGTASSGTASSGTPLARATLSRALLMAGDLPSGWVAHKPDSVDAASDAADNRQLAICLGTPALADDHHLLDINGQDFTKGTVQLSSEAESYPSDADVARQASEINNPRFQNCLQTELRDLVSSGLPKGSTVGTVAIRVVKPSAGTSSNLLAIASGVIIVRTNGKMVPVFLLDSFITGRRLTTSVQAFSEGTSFDATMIGRTIRAVGMRAAGI